MRQIYWRLLTMEVLKDSYEKHFAIIIGINKYECLPNLEYAANDAKAIKDILINNFNYQENDIKTFYDEEATKSNIMDAYYDLVTETCNNDSVLFFYAGHGSTYLAGSKTRGFLVPTDGTEQRLNTLLSWDTLTSEADMMRAKHVFFIMDACYSGLALQRDGSSKRFLKDMLRRNARQVLTAGKSDQTVKDSGTKSDNSLFTGYLIEALNGAAKTEQGVISASSVMNYVYNKVANDPKSKQTPGCGTISGEGDFIFNYDELFKDNNESGKDDDILVEIPSLIRITYSSENETITKMKELLGDTRNYIKVIDLVNMELKVYLSVSNDKKIDLNCYNDEFFIKRVNFYNEAISNLLNMVILLTYYGGELYSKTICRILDRIAPKGTYSGIEGAICLLYYPTYLLYYVIIITALESDNMVVLKAVLEKSINKTTEMNMYLEEGKDLLIKVIDNITRITQRFNSFYPEKNYKYPLNEYLYKFLQPNIDDVLFVGDDYPELFINTELLISFYYAISEYSEESTEVWGPLGRYTYQLDYIKKDVEKFPINRVFNKLELYNKVSDKKAFIDKYNKFLSKHYFY